MSHVMYFSCPYCQRDATLQERDIVSDHAKLTIQDPIEGHKALWWQYTVCPNPECRKYTLKVATVSLIEKRGLYDAREFEFGSLDREWKLVPPSSAKTYPDYIPRALLDDYQEACLIVTISPKASATLSRRCLQGMIRDFWSGKPGRLVDEIKAIEDLTDKETWKAIDAVRQIGNIGAHMEKEIDLIVNVDPQEAEILINLIEMLLKDWYITRYEREQSLAQIKSIAAQKTAARKGESSAPLL